MREGEKGKKKKKLRNVNWGGMLEPEEIGGFYCMSVELESAESGYTFLFLSVNSKIGVVFCEKGEYWLGVLCETRNS
jgi:hypothetical protein